MCTETIVSISIEMPHKDRGKQLQQYEIRISSNGDYATRQKSGAEETSAGKTGTSILTMLLQIQ
jgi:hypothetical protein